MANHKRLPVSVRLWRRTSKTGECWEWNGGVTPKGYGTLHFFDDQSRMVRDYVHRISWIIEYGPIPDGALVCHKCDNKRCVRPDHLFLGTSKDNSHDMVQKGRSCRGEKQGHHKLTELQAREILGHYRHRRFNQPQLAAMFGVHRVTITNLVNGTTWRHIF